MGGLVQKRGAGEPAQCRVTRGVGTEVQRASAHVTRTVPTHGQGGEGGDVLRGKFAWPEICGTSGVGPPRVLR